MAITLSVIVEMIPMAIYMCLIDGCNGRMKYSHNVDDTNCDGVDLPVINTHFVDVPMVDHYGNKYFIKDERYAPKKPHKWQLLIKG
jgi:hypothetical protein